MKKLLFATLLTVIISIFCACSAQPANTEETTATTQAQAVTTEGTSSVPATVPDTTEAETEVPETTDSREDTIVLEVPEYDPFA